MSAEGFSELARRCAALAPRTAAVLEGGYNLDTLPILVAAALEGFEDVELGGSGGLEPLERFAPR